MLRTTLNLFQRSGGTEGVMKVVASSADAWRMRNVAALQAPPPPSSLSTSSSSGAEVAPANTARVQVRGFCGEFVRPFGPEGTALASISQGGPRVVHALASHLAGTLGAGTTCCVEGNEVALKRISVVSAREGRVAITFPKRREYPIDKCQVVAVVLILRSAISPNPNSARDLLRYLTMFCRSVLQVNILGNFVNELQPNTLLDKSKHSIRFVCNVTEASLHAAARAAAREGFVLCAVSRRNGKLCVNGNSLVGISHDYPQYFSFASVSGVPVHRQMLQQHINSTASKGRSRAPSTSVECDVLIPVVDTHPDALLFNGDDTLEWPTSAVVSEFFATKEVNLAPGENPRPLDVSCDAMKRVQERVVLPFLSSGRYLMPPLSSLSHQSHRDDSKLLFSVEKPFPLTVDMLHFELQWHRVEGRLHSLLQFLPESRLFRFGRDWLLPLSEQFVDEVLLPMLQRYYSTAGRTSGQLECVGKKSADRWFRPRCFFAWVWRTWWEEQQLHFASTSAKGNCSQKVDLSRQRYLRLVADHVDVIRRREFEDVEGCLVRYFLHFPGRFTVDLETLEVSH